MVIVSEFIYLLRWRKPHGQALEVIMCELKRRLLMKFTLNMTAETPPLKGQLRVDWMDCTLECGDGQRVKLLA